MLWSLYGCAALGAYFIKGMTGFASTLVFGTVLSFGASNANISPLDLVLGYPANVLLVWRERREIRLRLWGPLAAMVLAGSIPGALLLKTGSPALVKLAFGVVVAAASVQMIVGVLRPKARQGNSRLLLAAIGVLSGLCTGLFGVGALLAAYVTRTARNLSALRGNLCMVFWIENTFRLALYAAMGLLTPEILLRALLLAPLMLLGLWLGTRAVGHVPERAVKLLVGVLLFASALTLIAGGVPALREALS